MGFAAMIIEVLKVLGPFLGAIIGALGALWFKEWLDRKRSRERQLQTRWRPLLEATRLLEARLVKVASFYSKSSHQWENHTWSSPTRGQLPLPTLSRDFHEIYLIDPHPPLLDEGFSNAGDPGLRRKDQQAVQQVRQRIHELNLATISLYRMAVYLGHAQRASEELRLGRLDVTDTDRGLLIRLLSDVRAALNGPGGAGIIDDLQDLIGKSVQTEDGSVISYHEFRERLLGDRGWEQFTDLFRFFVHFHFKIDSEVENTRLALRPLSEALERTAGSRVANSGTPASASASRTSSSERQSA